MSNLPGSDGSGDSPGFEAGPESGLSEESIGAESTPPTEDNDRPADQPEGIRTSEWHPELGFASLEEEEEFFNSPYVSKRLQEQGRLKARNFGNIAVQAAQRVRQMQANRAQAELDVMRMPAAERANLDSQVVKPITQAVTQRLLGVIRADPAVQQADPDDYAALDPIFYEDDPRKAIAVYGAYMRKLGQREALEGKSSEAQRRAAFEARRKGNQKRAAEVADQTPEPSGRRMVGQAGKPQYDSAKAVTQAWKKGEIEDTEAIQLMERFKYA